MNPKLFVAQTIRRIGAGCTRLQKLGMKRVAFLVIVGAFGSLSLLFFQNFTNPPPQPSPPANYVLKPNYKFTEYNGYPIPYVPRGNPRPMSPAVAADNYLKLKTVNMLTQMQINKTATCGTVHVGYQDKDPKTNLAVRTFTFACGTIDTAGNYHQWIVTRHDFFDRGPGGPPDPVGQLVVKTPVNVANVAAAVHK